MQRRRRHAPTARPTDAAPATGPAPATSSTPPDDLIPLTEACQLLPGQRQGKRLHVATLARWILAGRIRGWRVGGRLYVSRAHVLLLYQPVPVAVGGGRSQADWIAERAENERTLREHGLM